MKQTINDVILAIKDALEIETDIFETTAIRNLPEWSSMHALLLIALAETEYNVTITGNDLRQCQTVGDFYQLILNRS